MALRGACPDVSSGLSRFGLPARSRFGKGRHPGLSAGVLHVGRLTVIFLESFLALAFIAQYSSFVTGVARPDRRIGRQRHSLASLAQGWESAA